MESRLKETVYSVCLITINKCTLYSVCIMQYSRLWCPNDPSDQAKEIQSINSPALADSSVVGVEGKTESSVTLQGLHKPRTLVMVRVIDNPVRSKHATG